MIDTIRFKVCLPNEDLKRILRAGKAKVNLNQETGKAELIFHHREFVIPSYDYHVNLTCADKNGEHFFLEYSVPKIIYSHNVFMAYPKMIRESALIAKELIEKEVEITLPDILGWFVHRLDPCYVWKLKDNEEALFVLKALSVNEYQRKQGVFYDTTTTYKGSAYDIKFYLKHPEFIAHDLKRFRRNKDLVTGHNLLETTEGVLRYEATLRKTQVEAEFGERATIEDVEDYDEVLRVLNKYFSTFIKGLNPQFMDLYETKVILFTTYSSQRAINLFEFYSNYYHPDKTVREAYRVVCKKEMNRSSISRKRSYLRKAGVGIPSMKSGLKTKLTIPSDLVVEEDPESALHRTGDIDAYLDF